MRRLLQVRKRDGRLVPFERAKIADAIYRAARSVGGEDRFLAEELAGVVVTHLERRDRAIPTIEDVQDVVERVLVETGHARTAKAFILYRERRSAARAARAAAERRRPPLVGGDREEEAEAWSKARLADALVEVDGLARPEAEEVARGVEERLLASGLGRIPTDLVVALTRSEMFARGRESALGLEPHVGIPRAELEAWLLKPGGREPRADPEGFARRAGEALLGRYALEAAIPRAAAEAHRLGEIHLHDLGTPLALAALALPLRRLLAEHLHGEEVSRPAGPDRAADALNRILDRYGPHVARCLTLEHVNAHLAPFLAHLDEDALAERVRQWWLSPALQAWPRREGRAELELVLGSEVPAWLAPHDAPPPAPPGRTWGDYADAALTVASALLRESARLRRRGHARGPRLTLLLPRGRSWDAATRALARQALSAASETGEPLVVFERPGSPARGGRWLRVEEAEAPDPLRFGDGDVAAATVASLNFAGAALRAGPGGADAFEAEIDRLVRLALDAAMARRGILERHGEDPGGTLYPLRRGPVPLVDMDQAVHLVEAVGLGRAARLLEPKAPASWRVAFCHRTLRRLVERVAAEGVARGLRGAVAEGLATEAPDRLARLDALRYSAARSWWPEGSTPTYAEPAPSPGSSDREPVGPDRRRGTTRYVRIRHRVDPERRPSPDDLLEGLAAAADDACVVAYALEPWPRRLLRTEA